MLASVVLCIALMLWYFSWADFLILLVGYLIYRIYKSGALPDWRDWAYQNVTDIHQFQRSAELAALLPIASDPQDLIRQSERFAAPQKFSDDLTLPDETRIKSDHLNIRSIVLSAAGIMVDDIPLISWADIYDERVAFVGTKSNKTIHGTSHSTTLNFRFECPLGRLNIPMSSLNISAWKLDLTLYTYRGRFYTLQ